MLEPLSLIEIEGGRNKRCMKISKEGHAGGGCLPDIGRWGGWGRCGLACGIQRKALSEARSAGEPTAERRSARVVYDVVGASCVPVASITSWVAATTRRWRHDANDHRPCGRCDPHDTMRASVNDVALDDANGRLVRGLARRAGLRPRLDEGTPGAGWRAGLT